MTIQELNKLRQIKRYIAILQDEINSLRALVTKCTSCGDGMPSAKGLVDDKLQTIVAKITDLEAELKEERIKEIDTERCLVEYIRGIDDLYIKNILMCRFVRGMTWNGVAMKVTGGMCTGENMIMTVKRFLESQGC